MVYDRLRVLKEMNIEYFFSYLKTKKIRNLNEIKNF